MAVSTTAQTICKDALIEIGYLSPGEDLGADDAIQALGKLNRLLDNWNAERAAVYNVAFTSYTLTPNLSPHTIGPTGTFVVAQRPVQIDGCNILLNSSTQLVKCPVRLRDDQWWLHQTVPNIQTTLPTDLYYSPDWPNGSLYLWPVPTIAYGIELETRILLANVVLTTTITLPPGYRDAITLTLAEECARPFGRAMPADLPGQAAKARARVWANNDVTPRLATQDYGMPAGRTGGSRADFNWQNGTVV